MKKSEWVCRAYPVVPSYLLRGGGLMEMQDSVQYLVPSRISANASSSSPHATPYDSVDDRGKCCLFSVVWSTVRVGGRKEGGKQKMKMVIIKLTAGISLEGSRDLLPSLLSPTRPPGSPACSFPLLSHRGPPLRNGDIVVALDTLQALQSFRHESYGCCDPVRSPGLNFSSAFSICDLG